VRGPRLTSHPTYCWTVFDDYDIAINPIPEYAKARIVDERL
jgi:hypothetical protein